MPLLISGPGVPKGTRYDPVTTLDLARTIATWAGAELAAPDDLRLSPADNRALTDAQRAAEAAYYG